MAIFCFGFLVTQNRELMMKHDLMPAITAFATLAIFLPLIAVGMGGIYVVKWFGEISVTRLLLIETAVDFCMALYHIIVIAVLMSKITPGDCPPGTSEACDKFNWTLSFCYFSLFAWAAGFVSDIGSWLKRQYKGQRLDDETELQMRRLRANM